MIKVKKFRNGYYYGLTLLFCFAGGINQVAAKPNPNIATDLMARYNNTIKTCSDGGPNYKCSGIIIRGVNQGNKLPHAWSLKPENKQKSSFSFAYLRNDIKFSTFPRGYDSGFILYPHLKTPSDKNTYKVFCAFPVDGGTDGRAGHGCGLLNGDITGKSVHCDKQGINTYSQWVTHFNSIMNSNDDNFIGRQCAFDMTLPNNGKLFDVVVQANQYIQKNSLKYRMRNNELLFHAWNENNPKALPLEAFFYIKNTASGLSYAQKYQKDYYNQTGEMVPIVGIKMPASVSDEISIEYSKSEQVIDGKGGNLPITYSRHFDRRGQIGAYVGFNLALPKNYNFQANHKYKLEISLPPGIELATCNSGSFYKGVCGGTFVKEYSYDGKTFIPFKSAKPTDGFIGNKNLIIRAGVAGTANFKLTPE